MTQDTLYPVFFDTVYYLQDILYMNLLAIDTSTEACSAALSINGEVNSCYELAPRRHAELILPMIDKLLSEAGLTLNHLDGLGYGCGPGAFTGVRIATGVIQGLAISADLPVAPISSLATLAQGATDKAGYLFTAFDARMHEIYYAIYKVGNDGTVELFQQENVTNPDKLNINIDTDCYGIGSGWTTYKEVLTELLGNHLIGFDGERYPDAADTIILTQKAFKNNRVVSADKALPVYLRDKVTR